MMPLAGMPVKEIVAGSVVLFLHSVARKWLQSTGSGR
jgi:hypothetical protein